MGCFSASGSQDKPIAVYSVRVCACVCGIVVQNVIFSVVQLTRTLVLFMPILSFPSMLFTSPWQKLLVCCWFQMAEWCFIVHFVPLPMEIAWPFQHTNRHKFTCETETLHVSLPVSCTFNRKYLGFTISCYLNYEQGLMENLRSSMLVSCFSKRL